MITQTLCDNFEDGWNRVQQEIYKMSQQHGFWPGGERNFGEALMLITSELGEASEAHRQIPKDERAGIVGHWPRSSSISEYSHVEEELADAVIRIMDLAAGFDMDLATAIAEKVRYNAGRSHKHGKAY